MLHHFILVFNVASISESDILNDLMLEITSYELVMMNLSVDLQFVINKIQNLLALSVDSLQQKVASLNLIISNIKITIFTSFQNKIQNVSQILALVKSNSIGINASLEETSILAHLFLSFTQVLQSLGKITKTKYRSKTIHYTVYNLNFFESYVV